jgi:hypothetical protein
MERHANMEKHGKTWKNMEKHGKTWKNMKNHGKHGKPWKTWKTWKIWNHVHTLTFQLSKSIAGLPGSSKLRCLGIMPCSRARTALINPATPAEPSRWPMFVFTDPTYIGLVWDRCWQNAVETALSSLTSPA